MLLEDQKENVDDGAQLVSLNKQVVPVSDVIPLISLGCTQL